MPEKSIPEQMDEIAQGCAKAGCALATLGLLMLGGLALVAVLASL